MRPVEARNSIRPLLYALYLLRTFSNARFKVGSASAAAKAASSCSCVIPNSPRSSLDNPLFLARCATMYACAIFVFNCGSATGMSEIASNTSRALFSLELLYPTKPLESLYATNGPLFMTVNICAIFCSALRTWYMACVNRLSSPNLRVSRNPARISTACISACKARLLPSFSLSVLGCVVICFDN